MLAQKVGVNFAVAVNKSDGDRMQVKIFADLVWNSLVKFVEGFEGRFARMYEIRRNCKTVGHVLYHGERAIFIPIDPGDAPQVGTDRGKG
jgi:hypothetical protein